MQYNAQSVDGLLEVGSKMKRVYFQAFLTKTQRLHPYVEDVQEGDQDFVSVVTAVKGGKSSRLESGL